MPRRWRRAERLRSALAALAFATGLAAQAAVDVNRADLATLEAVTGVGPTLAAAILEERDRAPFADWADLLRRVKGLGPASAARLSQAGLTVSGATYAPSAARAAASR